MRIDEPTARLIEEFRGGDESAAAELYRRFHAEVMAHGRRMLLAGCDAAGVDLSGVVQETFRSFFSEIRKPGFDDRGGQVVGLLIRIVQRKFLKAREAARRLPASVDPQEGGHVWDLMSAVLDGEMTEQEVRSEIDDTVARLLADLTRLERKVVGLFLAPGPERTMAQVARSARCTETTARTIVEQFIEQLDAELNPGPGHDQGGR